MEAEGYREKIDALIKLLEAERVSFGEIESVCKLANGINPKIDKLVKSISPIISTLKNLQEGDVVELSAEVIPAETEKERKRKKALILFIKTWKDLESEIQRVKVELDKSHGQSASNQATSTAKLMIGAKGAFGLVTVAAILIVGGFLYFNSKKEAVPSIEKTTVPSQELPSGSKTKVIIFQDKKIPFDAVYIGTGPDCDSSHYHALDHASVRALDGVVVNDPGSCGFGRVKETQVVEI